MADNLLDYARAGALARLNEIDAEQKRLLKNFPGLKASPAGTAAPAARTTRVVSAAGRRAVSLAQKRRWAEWRKRKAAEGGKKK